MRVRRRLTPRIRCSPGSGWRRAAAVVAVIAASVLMAGAPAALAGDNAPHAPPAEAAPSLGPHAQRSLGALDDLPAQEAPTPEDEIPDVSLTLGGASHTVDVEGYFSDSVNQYNVSASPSGIVHTSRSGTVITIEPLAIGTADRHREGEEIRWQRAEAIHRHGGGDGLRPHRYRQHSGSDHRRGRNPRSHRLGLLRAARGSRTRRGPRTRESRRSPSMARW